MSDVSRPPVALALLNWNSWRVTIDCLSSLARQQYPNADMYLCDNASADDSVKQILAWAHGQGWITRLVEPSGMEKTGSIEDPYLTVIRSADNRGFAGGTNLAIRYALASTRTYRYIWVLNTDTVVEDNALTNVVTALESHPEAASAQSLLISAKDRDLLDSAGVRLLVRGGAIDLLHGRPRSDLKPVLRDRQTIRIFGCCAAAALYRSEWLRRSGLFDEIFFAGFEDVDLACRLRRAGQAALLVPSSVVFHIGGLSRTRRKLGRSWWRAHRNKLWLVARWWPRELATPILILGLVRALLAVIRASEMTMRDWWDLTQTAWREFSKGATGDARRMILRLGTLTLGSE